MSPTPPPAVFPCTRVTTSLGVRIIARITLANPEKNRSPAGLSPTVLSSSNEAPAQNGPLPSLRSPITRAAGARPAAPIASASFPSSAPGSELLLGCPKVTVATPSRTWVPTVPASSTGGGEWGWLTGAGPYRDGDRSIFFNIRKCLPSKRIAKIRRASRGARTDGSYSQQSPRPRATGGPGAARVLRGPARARGDGGAPGPGARGGPETADPDD